MATISLDAENRRPRPAERFDAHGNARVDLAAIFALAGPLIVSSAMQTVLNVTDTWFIGRVSASAVAGVAAVHWWIVVAVLLLSGVAVAVQPLSARAFGARQPERAGRAVWMAMWGILFTLPLYIAFAAGGHALLRQFGLDAEIAAFAGEFWQYRVGGAFFGVATMAVLGFFNGVGSPAITLRTSLLIAASNAVLNYIFVLMLDLGVVGSACASIVAQAIGLVYALRCFLGERFARDFHSRKTWMIDLRAVLAQFRFGTPMGLLYAADLVGVGLFQLMQVRLGTAEGAATQITMILTSLAYLPGVGIALAGTTLVGQSIGAGEPAWAKKVGTWVIGCTSVYMGSAGIVLAALGPWVIPLFVEGSDPQAQAVLHIGVQLLWVAAAYQLFDGLYLGSGLALRGAGDALVPALIVLGSSWFVFVPLVHMLTFAPGQGWIEGLPQFGWGAVGGWVALVIHVMIIGPLLFWRWRSEAWRNSPAA